MFERVVTVGSSVSSGIADQVISSGWVDKAVYPLVLSDGAEHKLTAAPVVDSVTGSVDTALTVNDDYSIVPDSNSPSGYSIVLNLAGSTLTTVSQSITIVYTSFIPVASEKIYAGTSSLTLSAYSMLIEHTDSNAKTRSIELFSVNNNSGGFVFNFKGSDEDGTEEMPLTFTADIDTSLTDGRQLFVWTVEDGAE